MMPLAVVLGLTGALAAGPTDGARWPPELEALTVRRADWDPHPPVLRGVTRYPLRRGSVLRWIVVHHSSFEEPPGPLGLVQYHRQVYGWADIGYHFVIDADGVVYEGRDIRFMGAHAGQTREANTAVRAARSAGRDAVDDARSLDPDFGAVGIVVDGAFFVAPPSPRQQRALARLVAVLSTWLHIDADDVIGHREVHARIVRAQGLTFVGDDTICPGDGLQLVVERLRTHLRALAASTGAQ